jgi:hydroxymethylpyrimidine pyrophosphatase-like HAD family hydrolase
LITIDLDGTTLSSVDEGASFDVPQENKDVLKEVSEAGHIIAIVTGRP